MVMSSFYGEGRPQVTLRVLYQTMDKHQGQNLTLLLQDSCKKLHHLKESDPERFGLVTGKQKNNFPNCLTVVFIIFSLYSRHPLFLNLSKLILNHRQHIHLACTSLNFILLQNLHKINKIILKASCNFFVFEF